MREFDVVLQPGAYDADKRSVDTGIVFEDESLTVQSEKEDADINTIVRRFGLTGTLPQNLRPPMFEDFADVFDFQTAMNAVREAELAFMQLPADVRLRFGHDPQKFVEFCSHTSLKDGKEVLTNIEEMRKLGLAVPAVVVEDRSGEEEPNGE